MSNLPLNFVALVGSMDQGSMASAIANTLDELAPDDVQVSILPGAADPPHYDEQVGAGATPPWLASLGRDIWLADGVIIVTPEYNRSLPGALKDTLDWLAQLPARPLAGKPVAIQTASPCAFGGIRVQAHLREILFSMEALVLSTPEISVSDANSKIDSTTNCLMDTKTRLDIAIQLAALSHFARHQMLSDLIFSVDSGGAKDRR